MIRADEPDDVQDVADGIAEGGAVGMVVVNESAIKADLHHTALRSEGADAVVVQVAAMVAEGAAGGMGGDDGASAEANNIVESGISSVRYVDHHADAVHLSHHLAPEGTEASPLALSGGRVAEFVVSVVTECHVRHAHALECVQSGEVAADSVTVLDGGNDGASALALEAAEVVRGASDAEEVRVADGLLLDACESLDGVVEGAAVSLVVTLALREVGRHDDGVESSLAHER